MPLASNQQLFEYRVERVLGHGAFGTVYLAHDTRLDRPVAIRGLTVTAQTDEMAFKCFLQEARAAGGLSHPHVVAIHAAKVVGADVYLVMEYLAGGSLQALLEKHGPLPVRAAVRIAADVCEGLAAAHAQGIVHRDVKPGNVLLTEDGQAKVGDFGIAHLSALTATRPQPETLLYMSPEQVRGQEVDGRSDVYQVGVLLYEMLTGRHYVGLKPLERRAREAAGPDAPSFQAQLYGLLAEAICEREPEGVCGLRPEVPEWVGEEVAGALAKRTEERPTAEELGRALRRGEAAWAALPTPPGAAKVTLAEEHFNRGMAYAEQKRWDDAIREYQAALRIKPDYAKVRENLKIARAQRDRASRGAGPGLRLALELGGYVLLGLVLLYILIDLGSHYVQQARRGEALHTIESVLQCGVGAAFILLSLAILIFVAARRWRGATPKGHAARGAAYAQLGRWDEALRELQTALRINPDDEDAHIDLAGVYVGQGHWDKAIGELQAALRLNPDNARAHNNMGSAYERQGLWDEAIRAYQAALRIDPDYARPHFGLAACYCEKHQLDEAIREAEIALRLGFRPARNLLDRLEQLSLSQEEALPQAEAVGMDLSELEIAPDKLEEKVRQLQAALRANPNDAEAHRKLGLLYEYRGRLDEAIREYQAALRINPDDAMVHTDLGVAYGKQGRRDDGIREYRAALGIDPDLDAPHYNLGLIYQEQGRLDEAIREYRAALRVNPNYAEAHRNLGMIYAEQGRLDQAIREYQAALRSKPDYADAHFSLGLAYGQQGCLDEAIRAYQAALRINPDDAETHVNLGNDYQQQGQLDQAIREYRAALRINPDDALAHTNLGVAYGAQNRWDEAILEHQAALRINANLAQAHYNLGAAYGAQGRLDDEIREYQAAVRINPDYTLARANLGMAYGQQGRWGEATREIETALSFEQARSLLDLFRGMASSPGAGGLRLRVTLSDGEVTLYAAPSPDTEP